MFALNSSFATMSHLEAFALDDAQVPNFFSPQATKIIPGVFIADFATASNPSTLKRLKVTHVISLMPREIEPPANDGLERLWITIADTPAANILEKFEQTTQFIKDALAQNGRVLVHCLQGISRSPTIVCAYLIATRFITAKQAIKLVQSKRKVVDPNTGFREQLQKYESQIHMAKNSEETVVASIVEDKHRHAHSQRNPLKTRFSRFSQLLSPKVVR